MAQTLYAQTVNRIEYFFGADPGFGNGTAVSFTPSANVADVNFNANTASLTPGFHFFQVRSQDSNGRWSIVNSSMVYKPSVTASALPNIVRLEYFFGADPGFGNGTAVSLTPNTNIADLAFTANTVSLTSGFHHFQVRSQDANGKWSVVNSAMVYKDVAVTTTLPNVARLEYFIDTDPGHGNGMAIAIAQATDVADVSANVDITGLSNGGHYFFVRSQDANGKFSQTNSKYFEINNSALPLTLVSYNAKLNGNVVNNYWATENEVNTSHFVVERSLNGVDFVGVGRVEAKNTSGSHQYYFNDRPTAALNGKTIYYRLQQADKDGKFSYSKIVPVSLGEPKRITVSPNPTSGIVNVYAPKAKSVSVFSVGGAEVYTAKLNQAWDSTTIDLSRLPKGTYLVKVVEENGTITTEKIIVR